MTDKEKLEKIKKLADAMYYAAFNLTTDASLLRKAMDEYHQFIIYKYYKKEPVSEELEEAAYYNCIDRLSKESIEDFKTCAKWQMAKLMKDATEVTVHIDAGGYPCIPQMELYDYDKDEPLAKEGDKYKVVLIKED